MTSAGYATYPGPRAQWKRQRSGDPTIPPARRSAASNPCTWTTCCSSKNGPNHSTTDPSSINSLLPAAGCSGSCPCGGPAPRGSPAQQHQPPQGRPIEEPRLATTVEIRVSCRCVPNGNPSGTPVDVTSPRFTILVRKGSGWPVAGRLQEWNAVKGPRSFGILKLRRLSRAVWFSGR